MGPEENKDLVRRIIEEFWNQGDGSKLDEFYAQHLRQEIAQHHRELVDAFSDLRVTIEEPPGLIAEGDYVAMRLTVAGTHDSAPFSGVKPSGKRMVWESLRVFRITDGRVTQTWAMQDRLGLMQQLGLVPSIETEVHWAAEEHEA